MVTYKELELIKLALGMAETQTDNLADYAEESLHYKVFEDAQELGKIADGLRGKGLLDGNVVTERGLAEIEPYRVKNAIILAAGGAAKNSKSIYSLPKGLYIKDGETLIERQIRQLKEVGIDNITVVVGYRQELYFFLQLQYGVELVCSPSPKAGNVVSLNVVADHLDRTYICCCDNYFAENPFSVYEYDSFHASVWKEDASQEIKATTNRSGRITGLVIDAEPGECLYGHAFVDEKFSSRLAEYMAKDLKVLRVNQLVWEEVALSRHTEDMDMHIRHYSDDFLFEFDSIAETQSTETLFINDVSDKIKAKICQVLNCANEDIHNIQVQEVGMVNVNITFIVNGQKYMFRYPGETSSELSSRVQEYTAERLAMEHGLDNACIYIDKEGCKIAKYRENARDLSAVWYETPELIHTAVEKMRYMHDKTRGLDLEGMDFDPIAEGDRLMAIASSRKGDLSECFGQLREDCVRVRDYMNRDGWDKVLSHHDWKYDNVLITDDTYDVIDWEYGTMDDPGSDLMRVLFGYDMDDPRFNEIIDLYLGHEATEDERVHLIAAWAPNSWYWLGWLMYQEALGEECGFWTILYWQKCLEGCRTALPYYEKKYGKN